MINRLVRRDLLDLEQRLRDNLHKVLSFSSHALFFPQSKPSSLPEWLPEEQKLLLPLEHRGECLGVFMAREPNVERIEALLPSLPDIASLCLENLELYKRGRRDPQTGLATREVLLGELTHEVEAIQASFGGGMDEGEEIRPNSHCLGLLAVRLSGLEQLTKEISYGFVETFIASLAEALAGVLPEQAMPVRISEQELGVFLPEGHRQQCEQLAGDILMALDQVRHVNPMTGRKHGIASHVGYALYPQDMDGARHREDQARQLLNKACLAAAEARANEQRLGNRIMGYGRLLYEGGRLTQILPLSRVSTSLGKSVGAREGQRFSVWSVRYDVQGAALGEELQPLYKGEIVLLEVREAESVAEILHLGDPAWPLEPGDTMTLLPEERGFAVQETPDHSKDAPYRPDPLTGLYRHGDFLAKLVKKTAEYEPFALALIHLDINHNEQGDSLSSFSGDRRTTPPDHLMALVSDQCRNAFANLPEGAGESVVLGGRFGLNSLVFYHPGLSSDVLLALYRSICTEVSERLGMRAGAGIGIWPFLDFRPADILECTRKALEYALLLPFPHVGVFDSLALNISADKRCSRGDVFGAIEEYKQALLADADNALAWNSLGVCMAGMGQHAEARRHFEEAWKRTPEDPAVAYNLGAVCQSLRDIQAATDSFYACLKLAPSHLYAAVRLGQIAEASGNFEEARHHFLAAAAENPQSALPFRHLARMALRGGERDEAREHLHQALLKNPRDAVALMLMANLYLDGGEDPELAEALARQSVAQRPDRKHGWIALARALEAQGRPAEAREALLRAGEL